MKKTVIAAFVGLSLTAASVQAQSLQPQMSVETIRSGMEEDQGHLLVPILFMIFLILTINRGSDMFMYPA
ncbi:hypothetical protein [Roseicyclus persicicus]|uniref:Uncharacterized protein n=1 Tax=Roseicyclus persicicus TaxID=2650661 RepID=A0A7X6H1S6_9RHOB|nr:hypothetical protein [Roseibacterium persicicum]NKX46461.1 hypothetical protein [Roseibacterium persicicum]